MTNTPAPDNLARPRVVLTLAAWLWVLLPFAYGLWQLLIKIGPLFSS